MKNTFRGEEGERGQENMPVDMHTSKSLVSCWTSALGTESQAYGSSAACPLMQGGAGVALCHPRVRRGSQVLRECVKYPAKDSTLQRPGRLPPQGSSTNKDASEHDCHRLRLGSLLSDGPISTRARCVSHAHENTVPLRAKNSVTARL